MAFVPNNTILGGKHTQLGMCIPLEVQGGVQLSELETEFRKITASVAKLSVSVATQWPCKQNVIKNLFSVSSQKSQQGGCALDF